MFDTTISKKSIYVSAWVGLFLVLLAAILPVAIPVFLIQPFAAQTEQDVKISFLLRSWSPLFTAMGAFISVGLAFFLWVNSKRWYAKGFLIFPLAVVFMFAWLARQNHFEWMFNPLSHTRFSKVAETDFVADDDMVMAVKIGEDAVAFPVLQMAYHHVVQDVVGGMPITATY